MDVCIKHIPLISLGYLMLDVPQDVFGTINQEVQQMLDNNFITNKNVNKSLYGAIEKEFSMSESFNVVEKFATLVGRQYWQFTREKNNFNKKHILNTLWVNFQKKYEFNPLHEHTQCDLSFVIWVEIPYCVESEKNYPSIKNSNHFQDQTTAFLFALLIRTANVVYLLKFCKSIRIMKEK